MSERDRETRTEPDLPGDASDEAEGIDLDAVKDKVGFVLRAARRRPKLAGTVFVLVAALGLTAAATIPRMYRVEVKLATQRDFVTQQLSSPDAQIHDRQADNPTHDVANVILRRDNLLALVRQSNLVERWHATRSPPLRWKDALLAIGSDPPKEGDDELMLAQTLEKRMNVWADDSSVTIDVDWNDAQLCFELATLVQKNFVDARYDSDIAMITDAIKLLEDHAKTEAEQVDLALTAYQALEASTATTAASASAAAAVPPPRPLGPAAAPPAAVASSAVAPPALPDAEAIKTLDEKRRQIRLVEEERQRQLEGLKQQLVQAQLTLTPMHPTVIALQQKVDSLNKPSPELAQLKAEERALMAQIAPQPVGSAAAPAPGRTGPAPARAGVPVRGPQGTVIAMPGGLLPGEDPALAPARSKLEAAIHRYQEVTARLDSARLELDITKTAFRYRYGVITPAELPRRPKRPITQLVAFGSVLAAALLALLLAAAADWRTGRILETWQVRRRLKIDVLGEIEGPS